MDLETVLDVRELPLEKVLRDISDGSDSPVVTIETAMRLRYGRVQRVSDGLVWMETDREGRREIVAIEHIVAISYQAIKK